MLKDLKEIYCTDITSSASEIKVFEEMLKHAFGSKGLEESNFDNLVGVSEKSQLAGDSIAFAFNQKFEAFLIQGNVSLFCEGSVFENNLIISLNYSNDLIVQIVDCLTICANSLKPLADIKINFGESQKNAFLNVIPYFVNAKKNYLVTLQIAKESPASLPSHQGTDTTHIVAEILDDNQLKDEFIVEQSDQLVAARTYSESIMQTVREGLLVLNKDFRIITANDAFHRCFDTLHDEIISKSFFEINDNQWDFTELRSLFEKILPKHHIIESYKITLALRGNKKRTLMLNARQILSEDKKDMLILVAIEDITKTKLLKSERDFSKALEIQVAEKTYELQQSQALLNSILNSTRYGIARYEAIFEGGKIVDFLITYSNDEIPKMFNIKHQNVVGKTCKEVYPEMFEDGVFELFLKCMTTAEPLHYDLEYTLDGKSMWINSVMSKVDNSVTVIVKIVTDEKIAEQQLKHSNELLTAKNLAFEERILQEFSDSFSSYKTGQEFFDSLVMELSQRTGMDYILLGEVVHDDDGKSIKCFSVASKGELIKNLKYKVDNGPCQKILKGVPYMQTHAIRDLFPNSDILVELNAEGYLGYPLFNQNKKCIGLISVVHGTKIENLSFVNSFVHIASKRIELELQRQINESILEEKNRELKYNNRELQSFNYIASHDLQEPLRKIQLFTGRILEEDEKNLSAVSVKYFNTVRNAAGRMQNLIQALLTYSTSDENGMDFKRTNLNSIIDDIKIDLEEKIYSTNTTIISDSLPTLNVIPLQFHQLLQNLIANGIKYQKADLDPIITIKAEKIVDEQDTKRKMWKICVGDNGIGFDQQYESKIFELFQRLHGKNEYEGTGIGLAICKKIAQNHKGYIKVKSQVGKGSNFCIFVPTNT
ncbi:PAS domain-containing sensor histidine kinase [Flavobacterium ardleyense]|uniref:PAS domain-containing sensor histidine kinase n=1 Tax=Flavobacterium ardleyense TaxID=2038737 RepID=UPI00298BCBE8|nr:ATP-binding protein [Flavobacterium ardleyense]